MQTILQENYKNYETEQLVLLYQKTHTDDALAEIIRRNAGLLHKWVQDYRNIPFYNDEDLMEEAKISCWKAVENYDPAREFTFTSCLRGYVQQCFNRLYYEVTRKKRYTGVEPASFEELEEINKEKSIDFEIFSDLEVREFLESLEGKVQEIAIHLLQGYTKSEIARHFNIKPASVTYHCRRLEALAVNYFETYKLIS